MIETQEKDIVGRLVVSGHSFDLLELTPLKRGSSPFWMQEFVFEFFGVVRGFAQTIIVSRSGFAIVPYLEPVKREVKFLIEENLVPVETDTLISSES